MGILKTKLAKRTRRVPVGFDETGQPVYLTVRALRVHEADEVAESFGDAPEAPPKRDGRGKIVLAKNGQGKTVMGADGQPVVERDRTDRAYLRALARRSQAMTIAVIVRCLEGQLAIDWHAHDIAKDCGDLVGFYHKLWAELEAEGLDAGSFRALSNAVDSLSQPMQADEVEDARRYFELDDDSQKALQAATEEHKKAKKEAEEEPANPPVRGSA